MFIPDAPGSLTSYRCVHKIHVRGMFSPLRQRSETYASLDSQLFSVEAEMRRSVVSVMLPPVESDEVHPTGLIEGLNKDRVAEVLR